MGDLSKFAFDEFKFMIEHAVDQEELIDIRRMIVEATDLNFTEKESLSNSLEELSKQFSEPHKKVSR